NFQDFFATARYKLKTGIFTFSPGVSFHYYRIKLEQSTENYLRTKNLFLPKMSAVAQFKDAQSLRFSYNMTADFPDIQNLSEAYVLNNYNALFQGNHRLKNGIFHRLNLSFSDFNMFNFTNMNFYANYTRRADAVINKTSLAQISRVSSPINSEFPSDNLTVGGRFQKTFRKFILHANANVNYGKYTDLINDFEQKIKNLGQDYKLSFESNLNNFPNVKIGYEQQINRYDNGNLKNTFYTGRLFFHTEINFLKNFTFSADYSFYNYTNKEKTLKNRYSFLDAELRYKTTNHHWEFSLKADNLMN